MTIIEDRLARLDQLELKASIHPAPTSDTVVPDACAMEAVAWVAGEPWSDHPACASHVLGAFLRSWNDTLDGRRRQTLKAYIPRLVGSAGTPAQEDARAWMAMDWLVRTYTPAWLRLAGLTGQADALEQLPEMRAGMDVPSIRPVIDAARAEADAARTAAWTDADGEAARDVALAAARDVALAAAADAARTAACDAACDAALAAAWASAWAAAWAAAREADGEAARDAALAAAWAAAGAAAWAALAPTRDELVVSAHQLVDRMLEVTGS